MRSAVAGGKSLSGIVGCQDDNRGKWWSIHTMALWSMWPRMTFSRCEAYIKYLNVLQWVGCVVCSDLHCMSCTLWVWMLCSDFVVTCYVQFALIKVHWATLQWLPLGVLHYLHESRNMGWECNSKWATLQWLTLGVLHMLCNDFM